MRGQLGRVLFSGEDVEKRVGALSGGEAARLVFCRIMVEKPNVLVLDEPTNHLDLEAIHALCRRPEGVRGDGRSSSPTIAGSSPRSRRASSRSRRRGSATSPAPTTSTSSAAATTTSTPTPSSSRRRTAKRARPAEPRRPRESGVSWEEQKRRRNRLNALPGRRDKVLAAIEAAEARRKAIAALYAEPGFFTRTPRATR